MALRSKSQLFKAYHLFIWFCLRGSSRLSRICPNWIGAELGSSRFTLRKIPPQIQGGRGDEELDLVRVPTRGDTSPMLFKEALV